MRAFVRAGVPAVTAGLLLAAAVPPWGWWPTAFVGIALFDRVLAGRPVGSRFGHGMLFAAAWILPATVWMLDLSAVGWVLAALIHSTIYGIASILVPAGPGRRLGLVGAVTLAEFTRWSIPFGGMPLATIPMGQADGPLVPVVRVAGSLLLVALVVAVGVGLSALIGSRRIGRGPVGTVAPATGAVVAAVLLAALAPTGHEVGTIDMAAVQGGGPQRTRATPTGAATVFANQVAATQFVDRPVDLVLWPENVVNPSPVPVTGRRRADRLYADDAALVLAYEADRLGAVLVPGWFHGHADDPTANVNYSTAVEPDGTVVDRYDKVRTVPFGEFVPLRGLAEVVAGDALPARDLRPGTGSAVLDTSVGRLGVTISWEVFFDHRSRDPVLDGAQLMLNPTNGASYWLTQVQTQQIASSRLRAIETGRWVVQAAPTGFSAVIDPDGRLLARTGVGEQAVLQYTVGLREGLTWATRLGPVPMLVFAGLLVLAGHALVLWQTPDGDRIHRRGHRRGRHATS